MDWVVDTNNLLILGIAPYYFFAGLGILFSVSLFILLLLHMRIDIDKNAFTGIISMLGMFFGAAIFGVVVNLLSAVVQGKQIDSEIFTNAGIVFYGGLTGFLLIFLLTQKIINKHINRKALDAVSVCIPLFHFFGRIGCFFAGCCYGKESDTFFSIKYILSGTDEVVSRIPVQLIEATVNLMIFIILLIFLLNEKFSGKLVFVYLSMYAVCRFFIEFFRGDEIRGIYGGMSFSQIYSMLTLLFVIIYCIFMQKKERVKK